MVKLIFLLSREEFELGIRAWPIDSGLYLIYSANNYFDEKGILLLDKGWQIYNNRIKNEGMKIKVNKKTARIMLSGLIEETIKNRKLLTQ